MADFICGYPPVVTFSGQVVTWAAGEWDPVLFNSFTTSHYVAFTGSSSATFAISAIGGEQSDGTFDITVTGSLAAYVSGTDRALPKVGSSVSNYTTFATCIAAMNGVDDRMLLCYSTTDDSVKWNGVAIGSVDAKAYNITGIIQHCGIKVSPTSTDTFYQIYGDCSGITDIVHENYEVSYNAGRVFYYSPTSGLDVSGTFQFKRMIIKSANRGVVNYNAADSKLKVYSTLFIDCPYAAVEINNKAEFYNCIFVRSGTRWGYRSNVLTNCIFIDCTETSGVNNVVTTCLNNDGTFGTQQTLSTWKLWVTESYSGCVDVFWPAAASSPVLAAGTNCAATYDIHGDNFNSGSYPIGASLLFDMVDLSAKAAASDVRLGVDNLGETGTWNPEGGIAVTSSNAGVITDTTDTTVVSSPASSSYSRLVTKLSVVNKGADTTLRVYVNRNGTAIDIVPTITFTSGYTCLAIVSDEPIRLASTDSIHVVEGGTSTINYDATYVDVT